MLKRIAILLVLFFPAIGDCVAVHTLQVTIGSSATQVSVGGGYVKQVLFENNATHNIWIGDANVSTSRGAKLLPNSVGTANFGPDQSSDIDLTTFWVAGTQNDVVDVIYTD